MFDLQKGVDLFREPAQANGLQRLARGVIVQAALEARDGNPEAAAWLVDPETADTWLTLADVDSRAVLAWVKDGCRKGKIRQKSKGEKMDPIDEKNLITDATRNLSKAIAALRAKEDEGRRIGTDEIGYNLDWVLPGLRPMSRKALESIEHMLENPNPDPGALLQLVVGYLDGLQDASRNAYFAAIETAAVELQNVLGLKRFAVRFDNQDFGEVAGRAYMTTPAALAFSHNGRGEVEYIHVDTRAFDRAGQLGANRVIVKADDGITYAAGWLWLRNARDVITVMGFYQFPIACFDPEKRKIPALQPVQV
jgi:hypothetical protein